MADMTVTKDTTTKTLVIERVFNAPFQAVWNAWTNGDVLAQWWGPQGWETISAHFEFKPGGYWLYGMKCVDKDQGEFYGQESWGKSTYIDIDEPSSIHYKDEFANADGSIMEGMPATDVTVVFIGEDGKTRLRATSVFDSEEGFNKVIAMGVVEGMTQTWDRLESLIGGRQ